MRLATLIGDVVGSREHADRQTLHEYLVDVLAEANRVLNPRQQLELTVGDEFQGGFDTVGEAARASLVVRLMLLVDARGSDSRYGLGWGSVTVFDEARSPVSQDGPGWWSARAAIERTEARATSPRTPFVRTSFSEAQGEGDPGRPYAAPVEAFLISRDAAVADMSERQRRLLLGTLLGRSQSELAREEGITQSAVSQTLSRSGASAIEFAQRRLEGSFE